ncbi:MAG: PAS domain S-box protein, partial [Candidatus Hydrogenedentes bacterium]|nr:PAS domain S-box protein [Candidatus Hydrogenedentota bacterium]
LRHVFDAHTAAVEGPISDRWGTWVSAFIPITDPRTRALIAVLGIDIDAQTWVRATRRAALPPALLTLALLLILLARAKWAPHRPRLIGEPDQRAPHAQPALVVAAGLALTAFVGWTAHQGERHSRDLAFAQVAASRADAVAQTLYSLRDIRLEGLAHFFEGSEYVTAAEFRQFTSHLMRDSEIQAWLWAPAVSAADRARFEAEARAEGLVDFEIWQRDTQGTRVPADARDQYYPILYVAPLAGNEQLLGYELGSDPLHRAALDDAARTGLLTAADPTVLVQHTGGQDDLLVYRPVSIGDDPRFVSGFAIAEVRTDTLLRSARHDNATLLGLSLLREAGAPELLASEWPSGGPPAGVPSVVCPVFAFGKPFTVTAYAGDEFLQHYRLSSGLLASITGLAVTAALAVVFSIVLRRRAELERLVAERTASLREGEAVLRSMFSATLVGMGLVKDRKFQKVNAGFCRISGYSEDELLGQSVRMLYPSDEEYTAVGEELYALLHRDGEGVRETAIVRKDGVVVQILLCLSAFDPTDPSAGVCITTVDITDRKRVEQDLARLAAIVQHTTELVNLATTDGRMVFLNPAGCVLLGIDPGAVQRTHVLDVIPDALQDLVRHEVLPALLEGGGWEGDLQYRNLQTGQLTDVHAMTFVLTDPATRAPQLVANISLDITELKRERQSLLRTQFAMDRASDGIIWVGDDGGLVYVNDAVCSSMGYSREELLAMKIFEVDPDFPIERWEQHKKEMKRVGAMTFEGRHRTKDGRTFPVEVTSNYFEFDGKFMACAFDRDISQRKQADAALREKAALLEAQTNATIDGILVVDEHQRRLLTNQRFIELFDVPPHILEDEHDAPLLAHVSNMAKDPEAFRRRVMHLYDRVDETSRDEIEFKDGRVLDRYTAPVIDKDGKHYGRIWTFRDITVRRRAEQDREKLQDQLLQAQKMESVGRLAGGVAHDFNNMLGVIMGHTELALEQIDPAQALHGDLKEIQMAASRSANLTRQLLAFARKQTVSPRELDLNETVGGMLKMLRRLIGEDIDLAWLPDSGTWPVMADPAQIDQILANLCVNAR